MSLRLFALRRCVIAIPTILGVLVIVFALIRLLPGDAADLALGEHATRSQLAEVRHGLRLDLPLLPDPLALCRGEVRQAFRCQLAVYVAGLCTGDLGRSWQTHQPVAQLILHGLLPSLSLTVPIFLGHQLAGLGLAFVAACRRGTAWDTAILAAAVGSSHLPMVAMVALCQWLVAYQLGLVPVHGWSGPQHLVLPVLIGIIFGCGHQVRFYRMLLVDEAQREYVRCARAKGVDGVALMRRHVLPNVLVPIVTRLALELPHLILGSLLLERFFGIPGLGNLLVDAISARDLPVIAAMTTLGALLCIGGNLVGDVVCHRLRRPC